MVTQAAPQPNGTNVTLPDQIVSTTLRTESGDLVPIARSPTALTLRMPAAAAVGPRALLLSLNGLQFEASGATFDYPAVPVVSSVFPVSAPADGGTFVVVRGAHLRLPDYAPPLVLINGASLTPADGVKSGETQTPPLDKACRGPPTMPVGILDGAAPQPVCACCGGPQPGGGAPQPPVASSGLERGGSRSRLLGRERDRRRRREREDERDRRLLRDLSSRELDIPAYGLRSMSSLDVSHASHTLRQLSHGMRFAAQNYKCSQLALEAQFYAGPQKCRAAP